MPSKVANQVEHMGAEAAKRYVENNSFFNASWSEKDITKALNKGYEKAVKKGIKTGTYTFKYLGEKITICLTDGYFSTAYGHHSYTVEQLLKFGGK